MEMVLLSLYNSKGFHCESQSTKAGEQTKATEGVQIQSDGTG